MSDFDFTPIGDRVIVKVAEEQEEIKTSGGIFLGVREDVNKEIPQCGEIVAIGTGGTFPDCPDPRKVFSVGDLIYFNRYAGEEIVFKVSEEVETESRMMDKNGEWIRDEKGDWKSEKIKVKKDIEKKFTVLRLDAIFGKLNKAKNNGK